MNNFERKNLAIKMKKTKKFLNHQLNMKKIN